MDRAMAESSLGSSLLSRELYEDTISLILLAGFP